jgi:hypothetical protein
MIGENKVFPIVAPNETKFPFVVYQKTNITPSRFTKDGIGEDTVTFNIFVLSDSYFESVDIADEVRKTLEARYVSNNEIYMSDTYMSSINESFESNTYIQQIQFITKVGNALATVPTH